MNLAWLPLLLAVLQLVVQASPHVLARQERDLDSLDYRLPRNVLPERYEVHLVPFNPTQFEFTGNVTITVTAAEDTDNVTLHAHLLRIDQVAVRTPVREVAVNRTENSTDADDQRHLYVLHLNEALNQSAKYEIYFEFTGELRDDMYGFYRSSYTEGNDTRLLAATQFESTHARRAFPCFDEPSFKATFQINIARSENMTALSNMPLESTSAPDPSVGNRVWDSFRETVSMSTYLVAFVVADFGNLTSAEGNFSTWARREAVHLGEYSQSVGPQSLRVLEDYTAIHYPLPKTDQVALPDFAAGAMENWGLVTYRETALLYDNTSSTTNDKQSIAMTIAHELTHQWFGNLVTMDWWRYTWLNEGFARYFQYYVMDKIETGWRMMDQLLLVQQSVFESDALSSTASLDSECSTPGEISAKFGAISYNKGASVIRMMQHALTEETFRKGLQRYLTARQYDTAVPSHLYEALQTEAAADQRLPGVNATVGQLFGRWASQAGYPVISVIRNYQDGSATVSQARFFLTNGTTSSERWSVPLSWTNQANAPLGFTSTAPSAWILDDQDSIQIRNLSSDQQWVVFNNQQSGYYRVNYDVENWRRIAAQLAGGGKDAVHVLNRAQLLDDALNLARAGQLDYSLALNLTRYLAGETDYIPWTSAFNGFAFLDRVLVGSQAHRAFQGYVLGLLGPLYDSVGFAESPGDPHVTILSRRSVLTWTCRLGHADCVQRANSTFGSWTSSPSPDIHNTIAPNLKGVVYCTAMANGGAAEWDFLWERYSNAQLASEKTLILSALGCSKDASILNSYLEKSITEDSGVRKQDAASVFSAVYSNADGINIALDFLVQNFRNISNFYGGMGAMSNTITGIASRLTTNDQVNKLEQFVNDNAGELDSAAAAGRIGVETARANLRWLEGNHDAILAWLGDSGPSAPPSQGSAASRPELLGLTASLTLMCAGYLLERCRLH